jgi:CMP-N-acetylneuraminic acid synthetase
MAGVLGLIPARSGSVGVPGKNIRPLAGTPLIVYSVRAALGSRLDRTVVSTDSEEIATVAATAGAERPFLRPAHLATSETLSIDVVRHALDFFAREENWEPDGVFLLQPTSPFRTSADINRALDLLNASKEADSVVSMAEMRDHPTFGWVDRGDGRLVPIMPMVPRRENRQDLRPVFTESSAILLSRTRYLLGPGAPDRLVYNLLNFIPMLIAPPTTIDIDTEMDFRFADFMMRERLGHQSA